MNRRRFIENSCACGLVSLIGTAQLSDQDEKKGTNTKKHVPQEMNHDQIKNLLRFIDASQSEAVKEDIFGQLGYECFYSRNLDKWIENYIANVQAFLDRVNIEKKSKYWRKLEFNQEHTILTLIGRKVEGCACAFADCTQPPKSLCYYCCKNFQQELFGILLGKKVKVEITKAYLLGDDRCNTLIHII